MSRPHRRNGASLKVRFKSQHAFKAGPPAFRIVDHGMAKWWRRQSWRSLPSKGFRHTNDR